jgi:hypothetical protein
MTKQYIAFIIILFISLNSFSQNKYPQNYFRSPLDIPLILSGTFGELRGNHFHSGIDIKTQGVEGQTVHAVADGYVSRINISPYGYGNAIYITHPNGFVSVYAHLQRFNDSIAAKIKWVQYQRKSFAIEYFPDKTSIKIKKGDIIGFSGNSGSSGGPHLHYEIRKASNAHPINPLLFGVKIADHQYPQISRLAVYDYVKPYITPKKEFKLKVTTRKARLATTDTILVNQNFFIGIQAIDKQDGAVNKNGLYKLQYFIDSTQFFEFKVDELSFAEKRYINSFIDYKTAKESKIKYQRSLVEANTKLLNISQVKNRGIVSLKDDKVHKIKVIASDFAGQKTILEFYVRKNPTAIKYKQPKGTLFEWNHNNNYKSKELTFNIPKGALYDDIVFDVKVQENIQSPYSKLFQIGNEGTPLHKYCQISIKADSALTPALRSKACVLSLTKKGKFYYEGGSYKDGIVNTRTRSFGSYFIGVDTIAPSIKSINVYNNKNISKQSKISFKVSDNLSGIKKYTATLDGKWILMEYDPKKNRMYYNIDQHFPKGKHIFKLLLQDSKGNQAVVKMNLIRN